MQIDYPAHRAKRSDKTTEQSVSYRWVVYQLVIGAFLYLLSSTHSTASISDVCIQAASRASKQTGVPFSYLVAITRTETGRNVRGQTQPWPWAMNFEGRGTWFASEQELIDAAERHLSNGKTLFDLGCFQINYRWHNEKFSSLNEMVDPLSNALYAAQFLKTLYSEFGDWTEAAGAYHSRTEQFALSYKQKILANLKLPVSPARHAEKKLKRRENRYPFLKTDPSEPRLGSLVPTLKTN